MITTVVQKEETEIDIKKAIKASLLMTFFLVAVPINSIMLTQAIITYVGYNIYNNYGSAAAFRYGMFVTLTIGRPLSEGIETYGAEFFSQLVFGLGYGLALFEMTGSPWSILAGITMWVDPYTAAVFLGLVATA
ncbi:hypothetical protein EWF20_06130 [Sulfolobus sp. S-194]|uniref:hypothetical protein n=1 Tax=Sulfolobus sp. S-194 TaxID=2512240 RepID=UPI0014370F92|nr:hypothetical protein [Sulfolobus sp. S-194]QIW23776.1 hypothetical protein EWF20_06130 [Sulfolobus sp. S-194]